MVPKNLLKSYLLDQQIQQKRSLVVSIHVLDAHKWVIKKVCLEKSQIIDAQIGS